MAVPETSRRSRTLPFAIGAFVWLAAATGAAAQTLKERLQVCAACHGEMGNSSMESVPSLAGQPALFLTNQLILMREKLRPVEAMEPFVKGLKDDEITALAEHYAGLAPEPGGEAVDGTLVARGAELARQLRCGSCHLPTYEGQEQMPRLVPQRVLSGAVPDCLCAVRCSAALCPAGDAHRACPRNGHRETDGDLHRVPDSAAGTQGYGLQARVGRRQP